jgi:hypothetical protein
MKWEISVTICKWRLSHSVSRVAPEITLYDKNHTFVRLANGTIMATIGA